MALSGYQLAADLSELMAIGKVDLPALGATYAGLNHAVNTTTDHDIAAFSMPGGAGMSAAYQSWSDLRYEMRNIFGTTANNMQTAATVMIHVVEAYAASDQGAADSLHAAWKDGPPVNAVDKDEKIPPGDAPEVVVGNW